MIVMCPLYLEWPIIPFMSPRWLTHGGDGSPIIGVALYSSLIGSRMNDVLQYIRQYTIGNIYIYIGYGVIFDDFLVITKSLINLT